MFNPAVWYYNKVVKKSDVKRMSAQRMPDGVKICARDLPYVDDGDKYHTMDVYRPKDAEGRLPVILEIHGGGWYYGDKELNRFHTAHLARLGFVVVTISYRLCPEVTLAGQIRDCCDALRRLPELADEYSFDAANLFLTGDSAGGHLAAMLVAIASSEKLREFYGTGPLPRVKAAGFVCAAFNPGAIAAIPGGGAYFNGIFGKGYRKGKLIEYADFKNVVPDDMPPSFIVTCANDFLKKQNIETYETLKAKGFETRLFCPEEPMVEGHKLQHVFNVLYPDWEESRAANENMCAFFKEHIE